MAATQITSDSLIPIEQHFRVSAGPGAGKTHWLINHIKNVLHTSSRLQNTRKIACITYTNVAVETILKRLGNASNRVEVSTIHSFLYKHIVKPYARFIANEYNLNVKKIDGHDDVILSNYSFVDELKTRTKQKRIQDDRALIQAIAKARWKFSNDGTLELKTDYPINVDGYALKNTTYFEYKKMAWAEGILHHDDVLFFSYKLLEKYPFIVFVLNAKFPYFFIDEFQDSNPIQVRILKILGQSETKIGIIGDKAQSIYSFQGADSNQFYEFDLPQICDYEISDNRRSTNQIIDLLNIIRLKFKQKGVLNINDQRPYILVGNTISALNRCREICSTDEIYTLSRDNITSNVIKKEMDKNIPTINLLEELFVADSNYKRRKIIINCIKASELAINNRFKEALKKIIEISPKDITKKDALKYLIFLVRNHKEYSSSQLLNFHNFINKNIIKIPDVQRGNPKDFYSSHSYNQLAIGVNIIEDNTLHRTIHKSKGNEFDNVILVLKEESQLNFLFDPDLDKQEEHRIYYVAVSRAKKKLFISIPTLTEENRTKLKDLPLEILDLD